jgi:hypothetical protein
MNIYVSTLGLCSLIGLSVLGALRISRAQMKEMQFLLQRTELQFSSQNKSAHSLFLKSGSPIKKQVSEKVARKKQRKLPLQRLDIMPLLDVRREPPGLRALFSAVSGFSGELMDVFLKQARAEFELRENMDERALIALGFDTRAQRHAYVSFLKGSKESLPLFEKICCKSVDAKLSIHQIPLWLCEILFDHSSLKRVSEYRASRLADADLPLWSEGDLHQLKFKRPEWRDLITAEVTPQSSKALYEQTRQGEVTIMRLRQKVDNHPPHLPEEI